MKRWLIFLVILFIGCQAYAVETLMTFEEFVGNDGSLIGSFYTGITFETIANGSDWIGRDHSTGGYNTTSQDLGTGSGIYRLMGNGFATTALDTTGDGGKISFDNANATYVELLYSSNNTFYLEAYDVAGNLLDSDIGAGNTGGNMGSLRVDWNSFDYIAYVIAHDAGNYWLVDNIRTDATGIQTNPIPAPGALVLGSIALGFVGWVRRKTS